MTNQSTVDKLIEMRLTAMADAFRNQTDAPAFKVNTQKLDKPDGLFNKDI